MQFTIQIIGCGSALPSLIRGPSAQVITLHSKPFLIDCGEGTQLRLRQHKIKMQQIHHIFISHLHGDHFFGLIGLLSTMHLLGRKKLLSIYAPKGLKKIIEDQFKVSGTLLQFELIFISLIDGKIELLCNEEKFQLFSFPLDHKIPCWGFLFKEKPIRPKLKKSFINKQRPDVESIKKIIKGEDYINEKGECFYHKLITTPARDAYSYAYCSDTRYTESIIEYIKGVSVLYHEASFGNDLAKQAELRAHSTAAQAATIALKAGVGQLLIGHFSARYKDITPLLDEAKSIFPNTVAAEDGLKLELS